MTATKTYSDAEVEQILRENAQLRRWLAEYQRAAREQRKASEKRYAQRKRGNAFMRGLTKVRRGWEEMIDFIDQLPLCVVVLCSLIAGAVLAATIGLTISEVQWYETLLWLRGLK